MYGLAAEGGLKALIEKLVPGIFKRKHINVLVNDMTQMQREWAIDVSGRQASKYFAAITQIGAFGSWSIDHRYCADNNIAPLLKQHLEKWQSAADEIQRVLIQAKIDGVLL